MSHVAQSVLVPSWPPATSLVVIGKPAFFVRSQSDFTPAIGKTVSDECARCAIGSFHDALASSFAGVVPEAPAESDELSMRIPANLSAFIMPTRYASSPPDEKPATT